MNTPYCPSSNSENLVYADWNLAGLSIDLVPEKEDAVIGGREWERTMKALFPWSISPKFSVIMEKKTLEE